MTVADENGGALTRKMMQDAFTKLSDRTEIWPTFIHCHPLEYPFYSRIFSCENKVDWMIVMRLKDECFRKYRMGAKLGIEKWSLPALIEQYTLKLHDLEQWRPDDSR